MSNGTIRAECNDCGWIFGRNLDAGDGLTAEQNQGIGHDVIRNHEYRCDCDNDQDSWGENLADVDRNLDLTEANDG